MESNASSPPSHILGYTIRSRTRIYVSYIVPLALELFVYIAQIVADCAVSFEHFHNHQRVFGWATLGLILVPPVLTFIFVLSSKEQWANPQHANRLRFIFYQLTQMLLFPFFAIYRFAYRLFWSIEALFHDDDDVERMKCLGKAAECSTCELYHLIQAYGQSAPQIILQLYHMLTQDLFRDYETTNAQAISLVFSAIDLAAITTAYQRFESQRQVGRHYPWSPPQEVEAHKKILEANERLRKECELKKRDSQRTIASFPESEKIMANFNRRHDVEGESEPETKEDKEGEPEVSEPQTIHVQVHSFDEIDNDAINDHDRNDGEAIACSTHNATDDDKIKTKPKLKFSSMRDDDDQINGIEILDTVPDSPPPPLPPHSAPTSPQTTPQLRTQTSTGSEGAKNKRKSHRISQLESFKDMLLLNAQLYIKENVPHPPKMLIQRVDEQDPERQELIPGTPGPSEVPMTPEDVVDFFLPRPTFIINGIEQDDFAGKTIAFFGWISFVIMRMLSLASFCVFFPRAFLVIVGVHYSVMLVALCLESKFNGKVNVALFYLLLAYVYIFVILEFRIKFKRIRLWLIGYFVVTMAENIGMTMMWYANEEFESWWFGFIFEGIIYSGILFVATLIVYYYILKPKDVNLIVEDTGNKTTTTTTTSSP